MEKRRQKTRKTLLIITFLIFPAVFYYLSPYLIVEGTYKGIITGSFITFMLMFISSLLLGRAYCGWICPASGIQEQIIQINNKKVKKGNMIKWIIWVPWILFIIVLAFKHGGYRTIDPFYQTTYGFSIGSIDALFIYFSVLTLIVLPAFVIGRKSFCHHICWMAPFMIIGRKLGNLLKLHSLRLTSVLDRCVHCHTCTDQCPMSLPVEKMVKENKMEHPECILCGTCVDYCQSQAIEFTYKKHT